MTSEVRYHLLRPAQIVAKREECPVAYIPIGALEWHGMHNPVGTDGIIAEGLAIKCAERGGGMVFPTLYYGESRSEALLETNGIDKDQIASKMGVPPENFLPEYLPFSPTEQVLNYNRLLLHILAEVESLGFKLAVFIAGHAPLVDHATAAALIFNQRRCKKDRMLVWATGDFKILKEGDHAGGWETSHVMAIHPESVDLNEIAPAGEPLIGVGSDMDPRESTAEFGRETMDRGIELILKEVHHRLKDPLLYHGHGRTLQEGLWKETDD